MAFFIHEFHSQENKWLTLNKNMINKVELHKYGFHPEYPRIQINKHGEIVLAVDKRGGLTAGILIAKTPECIKEYELGLYMNDWEVCGELVDYNGGVTITLFNKFGTA